MVVASQPPTGTKQSHITPANTEAAAPGEPWCVFLGFTEADRAKTESMRGMEVSSKNSPENPPAFMRQSGKLQDSTALAFGRGWRRGERDGCATPQGDGNAVCSPWTICFKPAAFNAKTMTELEGTR